MQNKNKFKHGKVSDFTPFRRIDTYRYGAGKVYQVDELSVINYGDGRLLFRQYDKDNTPLNGSHRIIDGYRSEYILAEFKDGMYNGDYKYFKNNRLKEEETYKEGRKDGVYKEYYSDGVALKKRLRSKRVN